jgi:hypothetical protein
MTDIVLNAAPLFAVMRSRFEALGLVLSQSIDAFADARMRNAPPARSPQAQLEFDRGPSLPSRQLTAAPARGRDDRISKESVRCSF